MDAENQEFYGRRMIIYSAYDKIYDLKGNLIEAVNCSKCGKSPFRCLVQENNPISCLCSNCFDNAFKPSECGECL